MNLPRSRSACNGLILLCLLLGLWLRWPSVTAALPYLNYVDEGHILQRVMHVVRDGAWDPGWYNYPSLTIYLISAAVFILKPFYWLIHGQPLEIPANSARYYDLVAPVELLLAGRIVVLALSLGGIWLAARLARKLAGEKAAVFAALIAALTPALVERGGIVIVDTVAAFFSLAALNAAFETGADEKRKWLWATLCGGFAGLAFTAKYPSGAVILALVPVVLALSVSWRQKAVLLGASGAGLFAGMLLGMPALLFRTGKVARAITVEAGKYSGKTSAGYGTSLITSNEVGLGLTILAATGLVVLLVRPKSRWVAAGWILYALVFLAPLMHASYQPFRNLEPLVLLGCVIAAALPFLFGFSGRLAVGMAAVTATLSLAAPSVSLWRWEKTRRSERDSRVEAIDWLAHHARKGEKTAVSEELVLHPDQLKRIPGKVLVCSMDQIAKRIRDGSADWFVTAKFVCETQDRVRVLGSIENLSKAIDEQQVEAAFGLKSPSQHKGMYRGNNIRVLILGRK
ncbi:MAG: glycosyltransferase family 39 protein [Verrucomicrobiota bacterium]